MRKKPTPCCPTTEPSGKLRDQHGLRESEDSNYGRTRAMEEAGGQSARSERKISVAEWGTAVNEGSAMSTLHLDSSTVATRRVAHGIESHHWRGADSRRVRSAGCRAPDGIAPDDNGQRTKR